MDKSKSDEIVEQIRQIALEATQIAKESGIKPCFPWNHKWTRWSATFGSWGNLYQTKTCLKCGYVKQKKS